MLIVSFVNQVLSPNLRLGAFTEDFKRFYYLDDQLQNDSIGATGIEFDVKRKLIYVAYQSGGIAIFDPSFELQQYFQSDKIRDPHSIKLLKNKLLVVSTGNDSILEIALNTDGHCLKVKKMWTYHSKMSDQDTVHINSIVVDGTKKYVTVFGEKEKADNWVKARNGKILRIDRKQIVMDGLHGPHSLLKHGSEIFFCNSAQGEVRDLNGNIKYKTNGYLRGLEIHNNRVYIGKNKRRLLSKNYSKVLRGRVGSFESDISHSEIEILDFKTWKYVKSIPFDHFGREIYDIRRAPFEIRPSSKNPEIIRLNSIETSFIEKIKYIEEDFRSQRSEIIEANNNNIKSASVEKKIMMTERESESAKISILEKLVEDLQREIPKLHQSLNEKNFELGEINTTLSNKQEKISDIESRFRALEQRSKVEQQQIITLNSSNQGLNERIQFLEKTILSHESDLMGRTQQLLTMQQEKDKALQQLIDHQDRHAANLKRIEEEIKASTENKAQLQEKTNSLETLSKRQKEELKQKAELLEQLNAKATKKDSELLKLASQNKDARSRIKHLETVIEKTEDELKSRNQFVSDTQDSLNQATETITQLQKENQSMERLIADKINSTEKELKQKSQLLIELQDQKKNADVQVKDLTLEVRDLYQSTSELKSRIAFLEKLISKHESDLRNRTEHLQKQKHELLDARKDLSGYRSQTKILARDIKDIKESYSWKLGHKITQLIMKFFGWTSFVKKRI